MTAEFTLWFQSSFDYNDKDKITMVVEELPIKQGVTEAEAAVHLRRMRNMCVTHLFDNGMIDAETYLRMKGD